MKKMTKKSLLAKLDQIIINYGSYSLEQIDHLVEQMEELEQIASSPIMKINHEYIEILSHLQLNLIVIKDNMEAINLVKKALTNADNDTTKKIRDKFKEKGIDVRTLVRETKEKNQELEQLCQKYILLRRQEQNSIDSTNMILIDKKVKKLNVKVACYTLTAATVMLGIGYGTFKLVNHEKEYKNDHKIIYAKEIGEVSPIQLMISEDYQLESKKTRENNIDHIFPSSAMIEKRTVKRNCEPIISTLPTEDVEVTEIKADLSLYPTLNCPTGPNEHVHYHLGKSYQLTEEELSTLMKVVTKEAGHHNSYLDLYIEAISVTTVVLNRMEDVEYYKSHGVDVIEQLSAPKQFTTYQDALKLSEEDIPDAVKDGVITALRGVRTHDFINFLANSYQSDDRVLITENGNNYYNVMRPISENKILVKNK